MDGVNLSIHSVSSRRSPIPAITGQKTVVKLKDRTFELHFAWLVNTFYTFLDTFIDGGSPVWYARVVKEKKKKRRGKDDNREKGETYIRGQMKTGDAEEKRWKSVWIGSAKCKWWPSCSSLWFVFSCPSARVLDEPAASPLPALLS